MQNYRSVICSSPAPRRSSASRRASPSLGCLFFLLPISGSKGWSVSGLTRNAAAGSYNGVAFRPAVPRFQMSALNCRQRTPRSSVPEEILEPLRRRRALVRPRQRRWRWRAAAGDLSPFWGTESEWRENKQWSVCRPQ